MEMVIFDKRHLNTKGVTDENQTLESYCSNFSKDDLALLDSIYLENVPQNYRDYKVVNEKLVKMNNVELNEVRKYNKILTNSERRLESLKPTLKEKEKADNTIEILTLLQEVL